MQRQQQQFQIRPGVQARVRPKQQNAARRAAAVRPGVPTLSSITQQQQQGPIRPGAAGDGTDRGISQRTTPAANTSNANAT